MTSQYELLADKFMHNMMISMPLTTIDRQKVRQAFLKTIRDNMLGASLNYSFPVAWRDGLLNRNTINERAFHKMLNELVKHVDKFVVTTPIESIHDKSMDTYFCELHLLAMKKEN